jgi:putative DNA primase/helicase
MPTPPIWDNIPAELKKLRHWVLWKTVWNEKYQRWTKIPLRADSGLPAEADNQTTWASFENAKDAFEKGRGQAEGIGFVFARASDITGIDLDSCRDKSTGEVDKWAQVILDRLASYTEISPSGTGLHVLVKASEGIPKTGADGGRNKKLKGDGYGPDAAIEMYSNKHYFTVTGNVLDGYPRTVEDRQDELLALYSEVWPTTHQITRKPQDGRQDKPTGEVKEGTTPPAGGLSDKAVIARMLGSANAGEIEKLLAGDTTAYGGDDSAADLALANHLCFWTGKDRQQMDRIFRSSGLMRDKWDEKRGSTTYGERTIDEAIEGTTEVYQPNKVDDTTTPPIDPDAIARAGEVVNSGQFPDLWKEVYLRRHNGDGHIAVAMVGANLTANILNSHGIAVLQVAGESGDGKSHAVQTVAEQMGRWCDISGLSPMALLYHAGETVRGGMMVVLDDNRPDERQGDIIKRAQTQFKTGYKYKTVIKGKPVTLQMPPGVQLLTTEVDADSEDQVLNRTLLLEVEGSPEKDLKIIQADLKSLETGEQPLDDPDIIVCQAAFDLLKAKTYIVTVPGGESRIIWNERGKDKRANLRNYNIFRDLILSFAVMRWPKRNNKEVDGVLHVEATRQDFMDALALYHTVHRQMKTKLGSREIEVLNYVRKRGGRVSREEVLNDLKLTKGRLTQLVRGKNGQSGLLGKVPGFYTEKASENKVVSSGGGYYDTRVIRQYLCLSDTAVYQTDLLSATTAASWTEQQT